MSKQTTQPLWQLMLKARKSSDDVALSCEDCFLILEYLADTREQIGADIDFLRKIASNHLSCCPDCRQYYQKRLEKLHQMQLELEPDPKKQLPQFPD